MSGTTETKDRPKARTSAVKVAVVAAPAEVTAAKRRYWVGTMPESPVQNITAGGVSFPLFRGIPVFDQPGGAPDRTIEHGIYIDLTDEKVERVRHAVSLRVVRVFGGGGVADGYEDAPDVTKPKRRTAQVLMVDGPHYVADKNDIPMAKLVYMHRLDLMSAEDVHRFPPESMAG